MVNNPPPLTRVVDIRCIAMKKSEIDKIVERMRGKMLDEHLSLRTVKTYIWVCRSYFEFLFSHPELAKEKHERRIEEFSTWRVVKGNISASTQNVEFNALIYLYNNILKIEVKGINALRAKPHKRIPPILTKEQVKCFLSDIPNRDVGLISKVMYGTGLRINECLRLRLKDVDFENKKLVIHEGKGDKDRLVPIPSSLMRELKEQFEASKMLWEKDHKSKFGVHIPNGLSRKYKAYPYSWEWYWLFPARELAIDPISQRVQRHHIYDFEVQRFFKERRRQLKLPEYATPHSFRHAFATHFTQDLLKKGFPREMIEVTLMEYMGHVDKKTLEWYVHLTAPENELIKLPIESI